MGRTLDSFIRLGVGSHISHKELHCKYIISKKAVFNLHIRIQLMNSLTLVRFHPEYGVWFVNSDEWKDVDKLERIWRRAAMMNLQDEARKD